MVRAMVRIAFACAAAVALAAAAVALAPGCDTARSADPVCLRLADGGWDYDMAGSDLGVNAGLCYQPAAGPLTRTSCSADIAHGCDVHGGGAPNLACVDTTSAIGDGDGGTVDVEGATLTGFIHAWESGPDASNLTVTVYDATQLATGVDPSTLPPLGQHTFFLGSFNADLGALDEAPGQRRPCDVDPVVGCAPGANTCGDCADGYLQAPDRRVYCRADGVCAGRRRWEVRYSIPAVPTDRPLVIRVTGPGGSSDTTWVTTYEWNVFASPRDHVCASDGDNDCYVAAVPHGDQPADPARYQHDLTVLSTTDIGLLANAAGQPGGNRAGLGFVLGEVRDCDGVRVANAQVSLTPSPGRRYYFAGSERDFRPDPRQAVSGTGPLGLFVAFDQPIGKTTLEAVGAMGAGEALVRVGRQELVIYRDTATFLHVNNGRAR
jgi:hypothetical protein